MTSTPGESTIRANERGLPEDIKSKYEVISTGHAIAIMQNDFVDEWNDLLYVLRNFKLRKSSIVAKGGRKSPIAVQIDQMFSDRGWRGKGFKKTVTLDGKQLDASTHEIDYYRNHIAVEVEWNNKDPFFDRDLANFRLAHELREVSVGVMITRSDELQDIFVELGKGLSYGASTTHMSKLLPKVYGGGAGGCPLLIFGITKKLYEPDE